ncbi:MAG: NmrA family NAD(P)-binding protein, partial [Acidobacteriaceae bacterium]|nr:NmrA family NAD(P)-binding protein [Acidobacteriaceae bacterium]
MAAWRILVTGATGNVGGKVARALLASGANVRALVRNPGNSRLPEQIAVVHGDLT